MNKTFILSDLTLTEAYIVKHVAPVTCTRTGKYRAELTKEQRDRLYVMLRCDGRKDDAVCQRLRYMIRADDILGNNGYIQR